MGAYFHSTGAASHCPSGDQSRHADCYENRSRSIWHSRGCTPSHQSLASTLAGEALGALDLFEVVLDLDGRYLKCNAQFALGNGFEQNRELARPFAKGGLRS